MAEEWRHGGFGLYVHWPFCEAKCPYCDFNSHVVSHVDQDRWARAMVSELRRYAQGTEGRVLGSIYFGGGTPSLMAPSTVDAILRASREQWAWANDIEITLEANPRSVEAEKFEGFARAGVNRVSLGVQALRPDDLRKLGRLHGVDEALKALEIARATFDRVSFDLIYGRQGQTLQDWESELREALDLAGDHLSLYQLTIEEGTAFWDRAQAGGLKGLPDEDLGADLYLATRDICGAAGFEAYEVSNYARPDAMSRHNLVYWRGGDYVGIGPGAHGRITLDGQRYATVAKRLPGAWIADAEGSSGEESRDILTPQDIWGEYLMMGLRLSEGLDIDRTRRIGGAWSDAMPLSDFEDLGLIWRTEDRFGATLRGRLVLNALVTELLAD
ncbi:MAG: coproporphyrinogen III oxidase [Rhodobacteraceae bacterium]|uniref:Heme chaperone HemW n=1 Tax=Salipiger profundus TaxID=1229727 RepID=A0A1U7D3H5_9RHOB|nr:MULTISPECIES: radical SAM family heme chaperone HemW [Salipiger]APX22699.1 oxygen-independent coproporphyrinogen-3 oxidase [Salipiger profundus]MAB05893.1 coproporphyrinogen III oxidase [Paracoccaceae bacterium]GGA10319.1 coproporphyrinogen III oxidase [Salipiger profundus]SFC64054.1 oxygen-independent coproporphyrinogen-3 oxidase [Salipiger profundus]